MSKNSSPLILQVGKYYRTRDGRKAGPLAAASGYLSSYAFMGHIEDKKGHRVWMVWLPDGSDHHIERRRTPANDLVAEWMPSNAGQGLKKKNTDPYSEYPECSECRSHQACPEHTPY